MAIKKLLMYFGFLVTILCVGALRVGLSIMEAFLLIVICWSQDIKGWWVRGETEGERARSLGGFWIKMAKVWWRRVWSGNDSNT